MKIIEAELIKKRNIDIVSYDQKLMTIGVRALSGSKIKTGKVESSDGKTYFDLDGKRIIVNDGTNDRILIGYASGGF